MRYVRERASPRLHWDGGRGDGVGSSHDPQPCVAGEHGFSSHRAWQRCWRDGWPARRRGRWVVRHTVLLAPATSLTRLWRGGTGRGEDAAGMREGREARGEGGAGGCACRNWCGQRGRLPVPVRTCVRRCGWGRSWRPRSPALAQTSPLGPGVPDPAHPTGPTDRGTHPGRRRRRRRHHRPARGTARRPAHPRPPRVRRPRRPDAGDPGHDDRPGGLGPGDHEHRLAGADEDELGLRRCPLSGELLPHPSTPNRRIPNRRALARARASRAPTTPMAPTGFHVAA